MMKKSLLLCAFLAVAGLARATDFSSLSVSGGGFNAVSNPVVIDNFVFSSDLPLGVWGLDDPNHPLSGPAGTSLAPYYAASTLTISVVGGGAFDLNTVAFAPWGSGQAPATFDVTLNGDLLGGGTVSQTLTVDNTTPAQLEGFALSGFHNVTDVTILEGAYPNNSWQINDINSATVVPEPASLTLLAGSMLLMFPRRRRV